MNRSSISTQLAVSTAWITAKVLAVQNVWIRYLLLHFFFPNQQKNENCELQRALVLLHRNRRGCAMVILNHVIISILEQGTRTSASFGKIEDEAQGLLLFLQQAVLPENRNRFWLESLESLTIKMSFQIHQTNHCTIVISNQNKKLVKSYFSKKGGRFL